MAPERERARGSPQDSICITTATRFGSSAAAFAQRRISLDQYWISFVKIGEMPFEDELASSKSGVVECSVCPLTTSMDSGTVGTTRMLLSTIAASGVEMGKDRPVACGVGVLIGSADVWIV